MGNNGEAKAIFQELKTQVGVLLGLVALMWGLEIFDQIILRPVFDTTLDVYGIIPKSPIGLRGILFAPFLHGSFAHIASNTVPFLILGWLVMLRETSDFFWVTLVSAAVSGLGTWIFGSPQSIHIGASGVVFGYLGYLLLRGYFERSAIAVAISLGVGTLYGSLLWGVLPIHYGMVNRISWEGHLFGFLGGILAAWLLAKTPKGHEQ